MLEYCANCRIVHYDTLSHRCSECGDVLHPVQQGQTRPRTTRDTEFQALELLRTIKDDMQAAGDAKAEDFLEEINALLENA